MFRLGGLQYGPPQMFATVFTFACFLMFVFPLVAAWHIGLDGNVAYWMGGYTFMGWLLIPIPILFIVNFVMQLRHHRPKRSMILACLIVPNVAFFLIGGILSFQAGHLEGKMVGRDCSTWPRMRNLDLSWRAADKFLEGCKEANPAIAHRLTIQTCPGYEDHMWKTENNGYWPYLQFLEMNYGCVGFCGGGDGPLWTMRPRRSTPPDSCAAAVASVLRTKVNQVALQLMVFAGVCLLVSLGWMSLFGSTVMETFAHPKADAKRMEKFMPAAPGPMPGTTGSFYGSTA